MAKIPAIKNLKILGHETLPFNEDDITDTSPEMLASAFWYLYATTQPDPFSRFPHVFDGRDPEGLSRTASLVKKIYVEVVVRRAVISAGGFATVLNDIFENNDVLSTSRVLEGVEDYKSSRLRSQVRERRRERRRGRI